MKKAKALPKGMYELRIKGKKNPIIVQLQAIPIGEVVTLPKEPKQSAPEEGHIKFYVFCGRLNIYTSIGADNVHHASNKATKLFGPKWSSLAKETHDSTFRLRFWEFAPVVEFTQLLKSLPN